VAAEKAVNAASEPSRVIGRLVWGVCALTAMLAAARVGLAIGDPKSSSAASGPEVPGGGVLVAIFEALALTALAAIGAVVASRQPRNPIGWILCAIPLFLGMLILGSHAYWSVALDQPERSGLDEFLAWGTSWIWIPAMVPALNLFPLLFPTGRPLTPRWRPAVWAAIASAPALFVGTAFAPGPLEEYPIDNPLAAPGALEVPVTVVGHVGFALMVAVTFAAPVSLAIRFRRSRGVERQQLKWVTAAAAFVVLMVFVIPTEQIAGDYAGFLVLLVGLTLVAGAVAISMLRYRLYDIDLVIRRTLVYAGLTATLGAAYLGLVLLAGLAVGESDVAIAGSTLAVAALFRPVRARIQSEVDRRFYRTRYDAVRTLEGFGTRLRDEVDLDVLAGELRGVVTETVKPTHVSLWMKAPGRTR
jgi:hypothetical protein